MGGWDISLDPWCADNRSLTFRTSRATSPVFPGLHQQLTIFVSDTFHLCDVRGGSVSCCCLTADSSGAFWRLQLVVQHCCCMGYFCFGCWFLSFVGVVVFVAFGATNFLQSIFFGTAAYTSSFHHQTCLSELLSMVGPDGRQCCSAPSPDWSCSCSIATFSFPVSRTCRFWSMSRRMSMMGDRYLGSTLSHGMTLALVTRPRSQLESPGGGYCRWSDASPAQGFPQSPKFAILRCGYTRRFVKWVDLDGHERVRHWTSTTQSEFSLFVLFQPSAVVE